MLFEDKNGITALPVTQNLWRALQRLRPSDGKAVVIWADAVCINQKDVVERGEQIGMMRGIYAGAGGVVVWVGLGVRQSELGIGFARKLNLCLSSPAKSGGELDERDKERVRKLVRDPGSVEGLKSLVSLFRRQYWWRIWVIQEVAVARKAVVYCGSESISWEDLDRVCEVLKEEIGYLEDLFWKSPSCVRTLTYGGPRGLQLSRYSPNVEAPPLLELLLSHKSKKSTDPRDKVFALIGISSSRNKFGGIDYEKDIKDVFAHTARHIIKDSGRLDVICVKQQDFTMEGLPSWAPDWSRPPPNAGPLMVGLHHRVPGFEAAGKTMARFEFLGGKGNILKARGIKIDVIKSVGIPFRQKGAPKNIHTALHILEDWWKLFSSQFPDSNERSKKAVFCRAISCGTWIFEEEDMVYEERLRGIFELTESLLVEEDEGLKLDSQSSTSLGDSVSSLAEEGEGPEKNEGVDDKEQLSVAINASITMNRRRLYVSQSGLVGLGPWDAVEGDVIVILLGCKFPVILREVEGHWVLVGEAYVDGYMYGEAVVGLQEGKLLEEVFEIH